MSAKRGETVRCAMIALRAMRTADKLGDAPLHAAARATYYGIVEFADEATVFEAREAARAIEREGRTDATARTTG